MGSEDNKLKEEHLATTRTRKCILTSFSHQHYSVWQVELHSMEEYNTVQLLLPSGDRERSSVLHSTPPSGTQSIQRQKLKFVPQYEKVCRTETQRLCQPTKRQECSTVYEKQCQTVYRNECVEQFKTEYEPYTETECSTEYKEDCEYQWEGHGNDKVWAPIAGTCRSNPYETCSDVTNSKAVQVPYPVCRDVPEQKCVDVPRQDCVQVPDQVCTNQPLQKCQDVPRQACQQIHKKVPNRVSRKVPKKVCQDTGSHLDGVAVNNGPVVDARKNEKSVQFQEGVETPNSVVFGD